MNIEADIVKYKWWIVGGIVGLFVIYYIWSDVSDGAGQNSSAYQGPSEACIVAAEQLQQTQMAVNSQNQQYSDQLQANQENNAATLQLATIQAQTTDQTNTLAAGVANNQIQYSAGAQEYGDTLSAQVAENTNQTEENMNANNNQASIDQYSILGNTLLGEANDQAQTADTAIYTQGQEVNALVGGQVAEVNAITGAQMAINASNNNTAYAMYVGQPG